MNLSDLLTDRAAKFGDRKFLFFERQAAANASQNTARDSFRQTLTYRELDDRVNQACHFLSAQGLSRGDVFNLHLPNCPAFLILWFAGVRLGAIMMPTNVLASAEDGYFHFVDRKKDMIKRAGENISSGEVENVLLQHAAVFECAVIGLPDELRDESIVGVVVLNQGCQVTAAELIEFCAGKLAKFRVPQQITIMKSLPKTSVGKIQKHLIRNDLIAARD